jgi:putative membrane protein
MANERTLLAYIRTALGFVIVGVPAVLWQDQLYIHVLGIVSLTGGVLCLAIGVRRFMTAKRLVACGPDSLDRR